MTTTLFQGSKHAHLYSKFRLSPPQKFVDSIIKYVKNKINGNFKQAVDIGCGSGQSTIILSPHFEKVLGLDVSESQIECARHERSASNVQYKISDCKTLPIPSSSVHLVTLSQCVHWFNTKELFTEVKRILVPSGVISVYGYWIPLPKTEDKEQSKKLSHLIIEELHEKQLGKYWDDERYIVQKRYADLYFPFNDIQRLTAIHQSERTLSEYVGYLSTWSAYQKLYNEDSEKAKQLLVDFKRMCITILNENKSPEKIHLTLHTDFFMLMGHC